MEQFDQQTEINLKEWLEGDYDEQTKQQVRELLKKDRTEVIDAFYKTLDFGTGGLRGIMGVGSNRMNLYTVKAATQGLANYILKQKEQPAPYSVLIGFDSRHNSQRFAEESAKVLVANGIRVYLYKNLRPVPLVSFGCRYKKCTAAIMVTASHNPKEYNGYKVYWRDGAQVLPPHDEGIIAEVKAIICPKQVKDTQKIPLNHPLIEIIDDEIDKEYLQAISPLQHYRDEALAHSKELKVVYTPLYGAGITMVPKAFAAWGFAEPFYVKEQSVPNGDFPTTPYPNPEEAAALKLGIEQLQAIGGDILIATDPDSDRLGAVVMHRGKPVLLNGNEIACICLKHVCEALTEQNRLPERAAFIKTIVTSELFAAIAQGYKKPCFNVLTGFKYIGQLIGQWEQSPTGYEYIYGGEESYGTMLGSNTRDKDAVISSVLVAEATLHQKLQGKTLVDLLQKIYEEYGLFKERLISLTFEGKEGATKIAAMMKELRDNQPKAIGGVAITAIDDYDLRIHHDLLQNTKTPLTLPRSNVLVYWLKDGSRLVVRPSGTEPKIKLYGEVNMGKVDASHLEESVQHADKRLDQLLNAFKTLVGS